MLEHIPDDGAAMAELARVLRPGGTMAVTVPAWLPERVCWALSDEYHAPVRRRAATSASTGRPSCATSCAAPASSRASAHHAHALHSPYWWLRCAVGPTNETNPLVRRVPQGSWSGTSSRRPPPPAGADRVLNPVLGKSLVVYARKGAST